MLHARATKRCCRCSTASQAADPHTQITVAVSRRARCRCTTQHSAHLSSSIVCGAAADGGGAPWARIDHSNRIVAILHCLSISGPVRKWFWKFSISGAPAGRSGNSFHFFSQLESSRCNFRFAVQSSDRMETGNCQLFFPGWPQGRVLGASFSIENSEPGRVTVKQPKYFSFCKTLFQYYTSLVLLPIVQGGWTMEAKQPSQIRGRCFKSEMRFTILEKIAAYAGCEQKEALMP